MRNTSLAGLVAGLAMPVIASPAMAEPGDTATVSGASAAEVVDPGALVKVDDLRFGTFARPASAASMTITANGTVTATGEVAASMDSFPSPGGRGPARFLVQGTDSRLFIPFFPSSVTISNGSSTMLVDQLRDNVFIIGFLDSEGRYNYQIGGRLNVSANQEPGQYSGDFQISVLFL